MAKKKNTPHPVEPTEELNGSIEKAAGLIYKTFTISMSMKSGFLFHLNGSLNNALKKKNETEARKLREIISFFQERVDFFKVVPKNGYEFHYTLNFFEGEDAADIQQKMNSWFTDIIFNQELWNFLNPSKNLDLFEGTHTAKVEEENKQRKSGTYRKSAHLTDQMLIYHYPPG